MIFDEAVAPILVLLSLGLGFVAPWISRVCGRASGWALAVFPLAAFALFAAALGPVMAGDPWRTTWHWAPNIGLNWDVWVSPLGLLLALLVTGIGTLITLYGGGYLKDSPGRDRFFGGLFVFMGAMLGLAVTENLLMLFIFWELTSVASYFLIGFFYDTPKAQKSARDALLVTAGGGLALLAGILLLGEIAGSYRLEELIAMREQILAHPLYPAVLLCVLAGAFTKSAQAPLHFWLPGAMAAPTPVSAYLHSATMVKAGVFLLALMSPVLGGTPLWDFSLLAVGAVTMTWAAVLAAMQTELKRILALSTVSALGTLVMLLGLESPLAAKAAVVFLIVHAMYKAALFMVVGSLDKATGIRDVTQLGGLRRSMPWTAVAAGLAAASMSGLPPFIGFVAKELLYEVMLEAPVAGWTLLICGFVTSAAYIVVALNVGVAPFFSFNAQTTPLKKRVPTLMVLGPLALGAGSLLLGVFPQSLGPTTGAVASQIRMEPIDVKLKLWHGFNPVLLLSAFTVLTGLAGFGVRQRFWGAGRWLAEDVGLSGQEAFRRGLAAFLAGADRLTRLTEAGGIRQYFMTILLAVLGLIVGAFWATGYGLEFRPWAAWRPDAMVVGGLIGASALCLLWTTSRMTVVLLLGCVGFGMSALFGLYGAPDLAVTQLLIETLILVLFALTIYGLPMLQPPRSSRGPGWFATGLATALGACFFMLTLKAMDLHWGDPVSRQMAERSLPEAFGRNVVNVILVDFRALDTLGEISVLLIAALGVSAMLNEVSKRRSEVPPSRQSPVLTALARYAVPAMVIFSVFLLLRGHNHPGGGFIGGLVGAMSGVFVHLARPSHSLSFLGLRSVPLLTIGIFLAVVSGVPGLITEGSFLDAAWGPQFFLPMVGKVKLGTPLLFDIGVYAVVAGIGMLLYREMESWHARPKPSSTSRADASNHDDSKALWNERHKPSDAAGVSERE